jgi:hypothetical protein
MLKGIGDSLKVIERTTAVLRAPLVLISPLLKTTLQKISPDPSLPNPAKAGPFAKGGKEGLEGRCLDNYGLLSNYQFVTPAPYQVRGKLRRESSDVKNLWIPASAGMTIQTFNVKKC